MSEAPEKLYGFLQENQPPPIGFVDPSMAILTNDDTNNSDQYLSILNSKGEKQKIDYILTFRIYSDPNKELEFHQKRERFFQSLRESNVVIETVTGATCPETMQSTSDKLNFAKIHIPWDTLLTFAERMKMKLPLKEKKLDHRKAAWKIIDMAFKEADTAANDENDPKKFYSAPFRKDFISKFQLSQENTFNDAMRSFVAQEILSRARFGESPSEIGLSRMIGVNALEGAYPLHQGPWKKPAHENVCSNERMWLYENWARPYAIFRFQPLDNIRKYFGDKVAIYFAWLGFYTSWLLPVSILGLFVFIYGIVAMSSNLFSHEICQEEKFGNLTLCPPCDQVCDYQPLKTSCTYAKLTSLFENEFLIAFAVIMSCWGTFFLEFWARKQREFQYEWDMSHFSNSEPIRPEYESQCTQSRLNPVTMERELYMTKLEKIPRYCVSFATVIFMVTLVLSALFGVILYRMAMAKILFEHVNRSKAKILTTITAASINLIFIIIMGQIYRRIAIVITNWERPRTESEYDNRFTFKMYCFQFFNSYMSIFYVAFFKGGFAGRPGGYNYTLLKARAEECDPSGCLIELSIQMIVVFCGKQFLSNIMEIAKPLLLNFIRKRRLMSSGLSGNEDGLEMASIVRKPPSGTEINDENLLQKPNQQIAQWENDYRLGPVDHLSLFDEYLEMIIQFGFVTLFVSAFPLAPLFAYINNVMEIRLDAYKLVTQFRRPPAFRARDIGIWMEILRLVAILGVITNSIIIGYTSNFIPKFVYRNYYNQNGTLDGFVKWTLASFDINDFQIQSIPNKTRISLEYRNLTTCFFTGFRENHTSFNKYDRSEAFWIVSFARVLFIIIFQHVVFVMTAMIAYLVPNVSRQVKIEMEREQYLNEELLFHGGVTHEHDHEVENEYKHGEIQGGGGGDFSSPPTKPPAPHYA